MSVEFYQTGIEVYGMSEERELRVFDIMDEYGVDMDTAYMMLLDEEEEDE